MISYNSLKLDPASLRLEMEAVSRDLVARQVMMMMMVMVMMMRKFWVFDFYETFICYVGCLNLNCYISKKVQKNFLMGFKIW